jgi:signal transduction histidine kinase
VAIAIASVHRALYQEHYSGRARFDADFTTAAFAEKYLEACACSIEDLIEYHFVHRLGTQEFLAKKGEIPPADTEQLRMMLKRPEEPEFAPLNRGWLFRVEAQSSSVFSVAVDTVRGLAVGFKAKSTMLRLPLGRLGNEDFNRYLLGNDINPEPPHFTFIVNAFGQELMRGGARPNRIPSVIYLNPPFGAYEIEAWVTDPQQLSAVAIPISQDRLLLLLGLLGLASVLTAVALVLLKKQGDFAVLAQARSDFVANVSHELRTPLAQIRMFAETLLLGRVRNDAERKRSLEVIDQGTQ